MSFRIRKTISDLYAYLLSLIEIINHIDIPIFEKDIEIEGEFLVKFTFCKFIFPSKPH